MALTITHAKINNISDWTQSDLDDQIALGNYPPGTLLSDIVIPSDWNASHTLSGSVAWGELTGTLASQTDLNTALAAKANLSGATFTGSISATNLSGTNTGDQTTITGNAGTATALQNARTIGGVSFDGTANIVPQSIQVTDTTDSTCFLGLFESATGDLLPKTDGAALYNAATGEASFTSAALTGNALKLSNSGFTATIQVGTLSADRTISFPNSTGTLANVSSTQTLTNKTIDGNSNTLTVLAASQLSGQAPLANGGTGANLTDPNADRLLFWDDSAGSMTWLSLGTNLSITGTTINATGGGSVAWGGITGTLSDQTDLQTALNEKVQGAASSTDNAIAKFDSTTGKIIQNSGILVTDGDELTLPINSSPSTPASDNLNLFSQKLGGRVLPSFIGPSGLSSILQPFFARNKIGYWNPPGDATTLPGVFGFTAPTVTGFTSTTRNFATTNFFTRTRRLGYVTAATAGSVGQWRHNTPQFTISNGAGLGGFMYIIRFGISDAASVSGARMFFGVKNSSTPTNVEPSTLTQCAGVGHGASDTNLKIFYGGTAAQTPIDLGASFPSDTRSTDMYELALFAPVSSQVIYYQVTRLNTGDTSSGTLSGTVGTAIPSGTTAIGPWGYRTNNATALAVGVDIVSAYIETDN